MEKPSKLPAVIGVLLVVCSVLYYFYTRTSVPVSPDSSLTLTTGPGPGNNAVVGADVLSLLSEIKSLNIDTSFFQTPVYESLTDFSVTIPPEPVGKDNPFNPLPGSAPAASAGSDAGPGN